MSGADRTPRVFVIVLNWNGLADTTACLQSLLRLDYANHAILVVDNASSDRSAAQLRAAFPAVEVLERPANEGFTGGNNIGLDHALRHGADYVWLLNNDTVVDPASLKHLVARGESERAVGLLSPLIAYFDDPHRVQFRGSVVDWATLGLTYPADDGELAGWTERERRNVCLWGTALLIKRSVIERIGLLPERYFAYWEDTDYSLRAIRAGFQNVVVPDARVLHRVPLPGTVRFQRKPHYFYYMTRNRHFLVLSYLRGRNRYRGVKSNLSYALRKFRRHAASGDAAVADAYVDGIWNAFWGHGGSWEDRKRTPLVIRRVIAGRLFGRLLDG